MGVPDIPLTEKHRELAVEALALWLPEAEFIVERFPTSGSSGVEILIVDVSGTTGPDIRPGKYVLRVGPAADDLVHANELAAHLHVRKVSPEFADGHIPRLIKLHASGRGGDRLITSLHDLAGGSLRRYAVPAPQSSGLLRVARSLSKDLLDAWARPDQVKPVAPYEILTDVVGAARASACLAATQALFSESNIFYENGHTFLNPALILNGADDGVTIPLMSGLCHGDLNASNLHVPRDEIPDDGYWIMDIDQARTSFVGFDHAYLELSVLINFAAKTSFTVLAGCLEAVENTRSSGTVPASTHWLASFLTELRAGMSAWVSEQPGREDDLRCQFMLLRMIAALTWARRFVASDPIKARFCVAYAGWYARQFQRDFPDLAVLPTNGVPSPTASADTVEGHDELATSQLWESFWGTVNGFSPRSARYVLVSEQLPRGSDLAALGQVPWSMVIDLDPDSDGEGLYSVAGPVLATQRAVHILSGDRPIVDFTRGTAWLLAAGSAIRREPALPFREWVYQRLDAVRQLNLAFREAVGDAPVIVVVLPSRSEAGVDSTRDRLLRVLDTMDEVLHGRARFVYVGLARAEPAVEITKVPIATAEFLRRLAGTLGQSTSGVDYCLPGPDGSTVLLAQETMRVLQEHLEIVHDDIEGWDVGGARKDDDFWRGGLISWADLDAERDVARSVNEPLRNQLESSLEQHRTRTIVLQHHPGAGGTTAALRAAWDLHHRYPVAVLRMGVPAESSWIPLLADRLHRIFVLTEMPVLFVAEDGDLSEAYREALYRELAARNSRVTILYVRRIVGSASTGVLAVSEPLDADETERFERQYRRLAPDKARADELALLASSAYEKYRTPFFYGLITFEREFTKLSTYVRGHLEQVRGRVQDVLEFVALATIYSNTGLQPELMQKLMRVPTSAGLELDDLLGSQAARLVTVRLDRLRLLHQLLAEEVLAELLDGGSFAWRLQLGDLAMNFIESISIATDPTTDPIRLLFRQVFLDRQSGMPDAAEDKRDFAPLIETLDRVDPSLGHKVLKTLTEFVPEEPHFWNHLGRHQMYRLERDLDKAEEYLGQAIELAPTDHVHHHTLGLVRRSRMRQAIRSARKQGVSQVMAAVDEWFYRTEECFITARELNPEDIYGYITHVQAIIDVAKCLMEAARVSSVAELTSDAADWIGEYLAIANELLDATAQLYSTLERRDDYLNRCLADIGRLYGDLDAVIELWEVAASGPMNSPMSRRSLAQAYYVRGNRTWRDLSQAELERVVELSNQNLSYPGAKEEDYRLWFEAYKLLPEFDIDEALGRLQQWSARFPSWRAQYYRYCLAFHLWFTGRSDDVDAFRSAQQQSLEHMLGRAKRSFLWLAKEPMSCPLIAETDLGEWDRRENFWRETRLLQRVNGVIDYMSGPQAGRIQLDRGVDAFFVPAAGGFLPDSDEGVQVNFFLGFSPEGLRAWRVQRGPSDQAVWARKDRVRPRAQLVDRPEQRVSAASTAKHALGIQRQQVLAFCSALLQARSSIGVETRLSQLEGRVNATYRMGEYPGGLEALLADLPEIHLDDDDDPLVWLGDAGPVELPDLEGESREYGRISFIHPDRGQAIVELARGGRVRILFDDIKNQPTRPILVRGQVVSLSVSESLRGPVARAVELLSTKTSLVAGEVVEPADLPARVEAALRAELEARLIRGEEEFRMGDLQNWAEEQFGGATPIAERLGGQSFGRYLSTLPWLTADRSRNAKVRLRKGVVFGRLSAPTPAPVAASEADLDALLVDVLASLAAAERPGNLQNVGARLWTVLGAERYEALLGGRKLKAVLSERPGWQLTEVKDRPEQLVLSRAAPASGAGDLDALLTDVLASLKATRKLETLQNVGTGLRTVLGAERYEALLGGRKLKAVLSERPGWQLTEVKDRPDLIILSRTEP